MGAPSGRDRRRRHRRGAGLSRGRAADAAVRDSRQHRTFALLSITRIGIGNWNSVTGGQNSLMGFPIYTAVWSGLAWSLVVMAVAFFYQETRSGLILRA